MAHKVTIPPAQVPIKIGEMMTEIRGLLHKHYGDQLLISESHNGGMPPVVDEYRILREVDRYPLLSWLLSSLDLVSDWLKKEWVPVVSYVPEEAEAAELHIYDANLPTDVTLGAWYLAFNLSKAAGLKRPLIYYSA